MRRQVCWRGRDGGQRWEGWWVVPGAVVVLWCCGGPRPLLLLPHPETAIAHHLAPRLHPPAPCLLPSPPSLLPCPQTLVSDGYIPVVASVASDGRGQGLNVNADTAAGEVRRRGGGGGGGGVGTRAVR